MENKDLYEYAAMRYAEYGIDVGEAIKKLSTVPISLQCWQGDDVHGFESRSGGTGGGIQATGSYPGRARNFKELTEGIDLALKLIPGVKRLNLHASYISDDTGCDRDGITIDNFASWIDYARQRNIKLDSNATLFGHENAADGMTLSHPNPEIRAFWVRHVKACRKIAAEMGKMQKSPCLMNLWIPDGLKEIPADRLGPRARLKESLDDIYSIKYSPDCLVDSVESKVFGIGLESYTVGSSEFYTNYAAKNGLCCLLDNGHFHPTENIADKISSMLLFSDKVALHVTRPVRWDSDHVVTFNDDVREICKEIVACDALNRTLIGLDYFDASINRIAAWVIGARAVQKALLFALLTPHKSLKKMQDERDFTHMLALDEKIKDLPFGTVWEQYLVYTDTPIEWQKYVDKYEKEVLLERG